MKHLPTKIRAHLPTVALTLQACIAIKSIHDGTPCTALLALLTAASIFLYTHFR